MYEPKIGLDLIISITYTDIYFILYQFFSFYSIFFDDVNITNNNVSI